MRFNLDPPPILRLRYTSSRGTVAANSNEESENAHFKLNPRLFVIATLLRSHDGARERDIIDDGRLLGSTIASPHKLRNDTETASCNLDFEGRLPFRSGSLLWLTTIIRWPTVRFWRAFMYHRGRVQTGVQSLRAGWVRTPLRLPDRVADC